MKILQSYPYFYPAWGYGGITKIVYELSKELVKRGHNVTVFTTDTLDKKNRIIRSDLPQKIDGINTYYFKNLSNFLTNKFNLSLPLGLICKLDSVVKKCDIIHLHGGRSFQSIVLYNFAKYFDIPFVIQFHGDDEPKNEKKWLKRLYDHLYGNSILTKASKIIALTDTEANRFLSMGIQKEKIEIIPNGIDISIFNEIPEKGSFKEKNKISSNTKIILYLGRIHQSKGINHLIEAFSIHLRVNQNVLLIIAGPDDGYLSVLKKQIKSLNIGEQVIFTGYITGNDKLSAYVDADVLVYPCKDEIFGLVVFEAIMCNTPVIVSNDSGCGELINKAECGFLTNYGDVKGLSEKINFILLNSVEAQKKVIAGKEYIKNNLDWETLTLQFETVYLNCINNQKIKHTNENCQNFN